MSALCAAVEVVSWLVKVLGFVVFLSPRLAAVSAGLRALVSWLLAFCVIDIVCLGPVSLPLFGFRLAGLIDMCLGPVSLFPCFRPFGLTDVVCLWPCLCLPGFFFPLD